MSEEERLRGYVEENHPDKLDDPDFEVIFDSWKKEDYDSRFGDYFIDKKEEIRIERINGIINGE